jgi:hypothetical protein
MVDGLLSMSSMKVTTSDLPPLKLFELNVFTFNLGEPQLDLVQP